MAQNKETDPWTKIALEKPKYISNAMMYFKLSTIKIVREGEDFLKKYCYNY